MAAGIRRRRQPDTNSRSGEGSSNGRPAQARRTMAAPAGFWEHLDPLKAARCYGVRMIAPEGPVLLRDEQPPRRGSGH